MSAGPSRLAFLRSSTARFFALVLLLQLVSAASLLLFVRHIIAGELDRESRTLVTSLRDDLLAGYRQGGRIELERLIAARLGATGDREAVTLLDDPNGNHLAGNVADWPPTLPIRTPWRVLTLYRLHRVVPERMGVIGTALPDGSHLLVGHVIEGDLRVRRLTGEAMLAALLLAIPLGLIGAIVATRAVTARVACIADTALQVSLGDLSRRVPIDAEGPRDAFTGLGAAINRMLERIEALVGELRVVTDSLAHDLRSPLTRLQATIERAARETADDAALAALERARGEAETLLAMLATALQISRAEAGIGRDRFVATELGPLLRDLAELYEPIAEEQGFTLEVAGEARAAVHRELLTQALANLIDNALRYGGSGGAIRLTAQQQADGVLLCVGDSGPGIPPERREEALRRFGRLDPARQAAGAGLGLSLVAAVARLHEGTLELADNAPGLAVKLWLPERG